MADWARRLARIAEALQLGQRDLAEKFGVNQSAISRWQQGRVPVPERVQKWIRQREKQEGLDEKVAPEQESVHVSRFCFGKTTFRRICAETQKHIRSVTVDA